MTSHENESISANKAVNVILIDGSFACWGTLLDLSKSGARVKIPRPIEAGRKIDFIFSQEGQRIRSTVVLASDSEITISFDHMIAA